MNWINVNDKMPDVKGEYLVYSEEGYISVEKYDPKKGVDIYCDSTDSGYATHWMELPEPPKR